MDSKQSYLSNKDTILEFLREHETKRSENLNLVASENVLSPLVRKALSSDMAGRYSSEFYGGNSTIRDVIGYVELQAKDLFSCEYACVAPISGNMCDLAALNVFSSIGDVVSMVSSDDGGYPFEIQYFGRKPKYLPFNHEIWNIDLEAFDEFLTEINPRLIILGASVFPYPHPISEILEKTTSDQTVVYDASHVLGLIAGHQFQQPFDEGLSLMFGSTHKSFPGPQGGIVLGNDLETFEKIQHQFSIQTSEHPFGHHEGTILVDNVHSNRIAALGFALVEMLEFGREYAKQVVRNSRALGNALTAFGYPVHIVEPYGPSVSHQVLLKMPSDQGLEFKRKLESCGIFIDAFVRIGTAEASRRGMKETDMKMVAELINRASQGDESPERIQKDVREFCASFNKLAFCFDSPPDIF